LGLFVSQLCSGQQTVRQTNGIENLTHANQQVGVDNDEYNGVIMIILLLMMVVVRAGSALFTLPLHPTLCWLPAATRQLRHQSPTWRPPCRPVLRFVAISDGIISALH